MMLEDLPVVSLRLANVTGPRLAIGPIPTFYTRLKSRQSCFCSDTTRDFLDMEDFFSVTDAALDEGAPTGVFNVSTGEGHTIKEVFDAVASHLGVEPVAPVPIVPHASDDVPAVVLDPSRTEAVLGWKATIGFAESRRRTLSCTTSTGSEQSFPSSVVPHQRRGRQERFSLTVSKSPFAGRSILVAGGAGFVGSNLCHMLLEHEPSAIWIVDNLLSADISNVPRQPNVHFLFGSIADRRMLAALPGDLEFVFHLACFHGNQSSIADPIADHDNNALTSLMLFDHLKEFRHLKKVIYSAAGCAVAEKTFASAIATTEDAPVSLIHDSPYSISKLIGEFYGNYYHARHALPFVTARFQNVYGPREILGAGRWRGTPHTVWRNVTPTFIWNALHGRNLPVENGGIATRDFIYVEDLVRGLVACALNGVPGSAYNLASGVEISILELANLVNKQTANPAPIDLRPARDWDRSGRRFGDPSKSREALGFEATTPLPEGIARTIEWTRDNVPIIERCIAQHRYFMPNLDQAAR